MGIYAVPSLKLHHQNIKLSSCIFSTCNFPVTDGFLTCLISFTFFVQMDTFRSSRQDFS